MELRTMQDVATAALLPAGLTDVLPPFAAFEAQTVERLMAHFAGYGYERVKPPLIEFEETMLAGSGAALAPGTFRLMDPMSQRMLALRPDMTMQVARIASSRLGHWPRPLRLGYAGQVLRVRGTQIRPERQFGEVGAEIFGTGSTAADVEVVVMATSALAALGVGGLSVDLGLPTLVPAILASVSCDTQTEQRLRLALDRKDEAAIAAMGSAIGAPAAATLSRLVATNGPAESALAALLDLDLPAAAAQERDALVSIHDQLRHAAPTLTLTIDTVENRGFEYHSGVTYALFAASATDEIGRGGRYRTEAGEPATGITLFMDAVLRALPRPRPAPRLFVPKDMGVNVGQRLRRDGWIAVVALETDIDIEAEAVRLGCSHALIDSVPTQVGERGRREGEG
jgi:ATP phosphoribosyltransferase regulatory subunit